MRASFYYCHKNHSGFCFLVQIKAFVFLNLTGITTFKHERKNKMNSGLSSRKRSLCKSPILWNSLFCFLSLITCFVIRLKNA